MNKITTEDCVEYIMANLAPDTTEKDWKRISKKKWYDGILRQFENRKTGKVVDVFEKAGVITKASYLDPDAETLDSGLVPAVPKSKSVVTVKDCIQYLKMSSPNVQWTFVQKKPQGDDVTWYFSAPHDTAMFMIAEVSENRVRAFTEAAEKAMNDPRPEWQPPYQPELSDWDKIKSNQITVDLSSIKIIPDRKGEWTGRIVYSLNEIDDDESEPNVSFLCGPECKGGCIEDTDDGGSEATLNSLLEDMNADIGAAEMFHVVPIIEGVSGQEMWKVIEQRLVRSGAKKMKD